MITSLVISLITGILITSIGFGYAQEEQSDFILEMSNVTTDPKITNFELNGTSFNEICPSGKCEINFTSAYFNEPTPDRQSSAYTAKFDLIESSNTTKEDEYLQKHGIGMLYCKVDKIIQENNQELYYCSSNLNNILRTFDSPRWYYNSTGVYDAIQDTFKINGTYIGHDPW
ncbi:MAG: hypothetical protein ACPKPY_12855 [Nitrososphaeraceae archaeon]